jgi:hypothetical protein
VAGGVQGVGTIAVVEEDAMSLYDPDRFTVAGARACDMTNSRCEP